nr:reverse transcriptase domain-containing protein [Tanacetum cinerariifolium]
MLPVTQIDTFYNGLTLRHRDTINAAAGGTFMKRRLEEFYDQIENMTIYHNDWDTSTQRSESSTSITSSSDPKIIVLKAKMAEINKNIMRVLQVNQQVKAVTPNYETCGGPHSYNDCPASVGQTQNVYAARTYQGGNFYHPQVTMLPRRVLEPKDEASQLAVEESGVDETELGNLGLGSPSFSGNFLRRTIEQCSFSGVLSNSESLSLLVNKVRLLSTNGSNNGLNDRSNNGLKIWNQSFSLDNRRLDVFGASIISRRHRVLCHLGLMFYYFRKRR